MTLYSPFVETESEHRRMQGDISETLELILTLSWRWKVICCYQSRKGSFEKPTTVNAPVKPLTIKSHERASAAGMRLHKFFPKQAAAYRNAISKRRWVSALFAV